MAVVCDNFKFRIKKNNELNVTHHAQPFTTGNGLNHQPRWWWLREPKNFYFPRVGLV